MDDRLMDFYKLPDIAEYENLHLLMLREECDNWEQKVRNILERLLDDDRQVIEVYLDSRNDLEVETVRAALRWGKLHYK